MIRDQTCQFPGCTSNRHLQAHHVINWADGGPTQLSNLILLCQFHHTCVHEGAITITRNPQAPFPAAAVPGQPAWRFTMPDGQRLDRPGRPIPTARTLAHRLARPNPVDHVDRLNHPDAVAIQPKQYGERFDLHAAVQVLFNLQLTTSQAA